MNKYKFAALYISISILTGCLATMDLLTDGSLDPESKPIAVEIAKVAHSKCLVNGMAVKKYPEMKALYKSNGGWYKADLFLGSVWDAAFYKPASKQLVCGQAAWGKYAESRDISFKKVGVAEKSVNDVSSVISASSAQFPASTPVFYTLPAGLSVIEKGIDSETRVAIIDPKKACGVDGVGIAGTFMVVNTRTGKSDSAVWWDGIPLPTHMDKLTTQAESLCKWYLNRQHGMQRG